MKKGGKTVRRKKLGWKRVGKDFVYIFKETVAKKYRLERINFTGFKQRPSGLYLYESGGGFNWNQSNKIGGNYLLEYLANKFSNKRLQLAISANSDAKPKLHETKRTVSIDLNLKDFLKIVENLGLEIKKDKGLVITRRLSNFFKVFKTDDTTPLSETLSDINLLSLKEADHKAISTFVRDYFGANAASNVREILQKELVIQGQRESLEQVIEKFEAHLTNKSFDEKSWQKFLHEEVFFFLSNYIYSIREADVNFGKLKEGIKKPDFVWIDIYGFLDIFEIKTPYTDILAKRIDKSHKNYYLSTEASRAVSQIEKYILFLEQNVENFEKYLSKKTSIPFAVLKPKAFLIIGNTAELEKNPDKKRDFRLLRRTLKNVEFIAFNELLDNLKNLSSKFNRHS